MTQTIFLIISFLFLVAFIVGLVKPKLFAVDSRKKAVLMCGLVYFFCLAVFLMFTIPTPPPSNPSFASTDTNNTREAKPIDFASSLKAKRTEPSIPTHTIMEEKVHDSGIKTEIRQRVIVPGEVNKERLTRLLNHLYVDIISRTGFKYRDHPNSVAIWVYRSIQKLRSNYWVAMLHLFPDEDTPDITFDETELAQTDSKQENKFGLTEEQRKEIFIEIVRSEDRARIEAQEKYPVDLTEPRQIWKKQTNKQIEFENALYEKYQNELAKKHGITREQLIKIISEGVKNHWSLRE